MAAQHGARQVGHGRIWEIYRRANPRSEALFARAGGSIAGRITHDIRHMKPFPVYIERAQGTRKWTADGQELIDYWMGHGALFLGHGHPVILEAVHEQLGRGTHYGACHELEVRWAELVQRLVPSAERVRFTISGTEATQLALRLARAHTGKPKVVKFEGHFHGWHDYALAGVKPPYEIPLSSGIPGESLAQVLLCPPNDLAALDALLAGRQDVAAVILEPGGGSSGTIPTDATYLQGLRDLTRRHGVVLIFDEVITGFRYAPGGVQQVVGVMPDMTTLAKIIAGGLPGGAVAGQAAILDRLAFGEDPAWNRKERVAHAGTYNANPLSAAAGIAMLECIADGKAHQRANQTTRALRQELAGVWRRLGVPGCVYGEASILNYSLEPALETPPTAGTRDHRRLQALANPDAYHALRCGLILNGVDICPLHGWVSAVHTDEDVQRTVQAFEKALLLLREDGFFS
ncbi:MAG: aspartate aminotransferase family protein [candidate division NC10 bacterium]|nr:aspartate aminotransferase family protein [candidate division NC10 bacterium]